MSDLVFLSRRLRQPELMDDPGLDPIAKRGAALGLETIASWPGQRMPLLKGILELLGPPTLGSVKLVELGAGSGHLSRWLDAELARRGYRAEILATDLHPGLGVRPLDCLDAAGLPEADIYFSNLLLHHLPDPDLKAMLALHAKKARLGSVHFDLHRHFLHFYAAMAVLGSSRLHPIIFKDGLRSIQQGFKRRELQVLAAEAGLRVTVRWSFPFRWLLSWRR